MWLFGLLGVALAEPTSVSLVGAEGTLAWSVRAEGDSLVIAGKSPKWRVAHVAAADWTPRRTEHWDADGALTTIDYASWGATVHRGDEAWERRQAGLWDADTVDLRLGAEVAKGNVALAFSGLDPASGKVYSFDSQKIGDERCGGEACVHVRVQLTGLLRYVGPSWDYWYTSSGALVRFEGPAGSFSRGTP